MPSALKYVLTDAGFWIGLCDRNDQNHENAVRILKAIERYHVLLPWPILYEIFRTRFIKNKSLVQKFEETAKSVAARYEDDNPYRTAAQIEALRLAATGKRHISLVDMVIRHMLSDENFRIDYLVTFNQRDFVDVCRKRKIEIVE